MLVLTRRKGEEIVINENIRLTVVRVEGGKVRIGIEAPDEVSVRRQEVIGRPLAIHRRYARLCTT